jgi:hypothetical protein
MLFISLHRPFVFHLLFLPPSSLLTSFVVQFLPPTLHRQPFDQH